MLGNDRGGTFQGMFWAFVAMAVLAMLYRLLTGHWIGEG